MTTTATRQPHIGNNIKRIREMLGIKQEYLAVQMGLSQQAISHLEQRETVDAPTLEKVASILKMPVEAIQNYDEDATIFNIQNNYEGSTSNFSGVYKCTFNPLEKLMEVVDENKKLYERLVEVEREKVALMEKLFAERK